MKKFPKTLYVSRENEGDGEREYLNPADEIGDLAELGERKRIAVYELKEVVTVSAEIKVSATKRRSTQPRLKR